MLFSASVPTNPLTLFWLVDELLAGAETFPAIEGDTIRDVSMRFNVITIISAEHCNFLFT